MFIDISRIVHMKIANCHYNEFNPDAWKNIRILIEQACNLSSLIIRRENYNEFISDQTYENILAILPQRLKHLQMVINNFEQINKILERCKNLSSIKLINLNKKSHKSIIQWFVDNTVNTSLRVHDEFTVWLGRKKIQTIEIGHQTKRMKLNGDN